MTPRGVGISALLLLVIFSIYHNQKIYAPSPESSSAAAIFAVENTDANAQCPDKSETVEYSTSGSYPSKRVGDCIAPKQAAAVAATQRQCIITNMYKKPCTGVQQGKKIIGHCVTEKKCHADKYIDENGNEQDVKQPDLPQTPTQVACATPPCAAPDSGSTPVPNPIPTKPTEPAKPGPTAPAPARPEIDGAYKPITPIGTVPTTPTNPSGGSQMPAAPSSGSTPVGGATTPTGSGGAPTSGGSGVSTPLPTGQQPAVLTPINQPVNPTTPFTPRPVYTPYPQTPRPQTTFGNTKGQESTYRNDRANSRTANTFFGSIVSLFSGLFPSSSGGGGGSVTYVQNVINVSQTQPTRAPLSPSQPQTPQPQSPPSQTSKSTTSPRERNFEPVIIVPYSSPRASESDFDALVRALKEQRNEASDGARLYVVSNSKPSTPALPLATETRKETTSAEKIQDYRAPKTQTRADVEAAYMKAAATTTESTSTPRRLPPSVVEVGVAVDITDPASYESIRAYMSGEWAHVERTAVQTKAALAQVKSERESILAHLEALREAREAGICNEICEEAFSTLQQDLPRAESRIDALETEILDEVAPRLVPPPTVAQIARVAESLAEPTYEQSPGITPRNPTAAPSVANVASQETLPPSSETKGEAVVLKIVKGVWGFLKSWFLPSPEAQAPKEPCSLFLSLFGKCK